MHNGKDGKYIYGIIKNDGSFKMDISDISEEIKSIYCVNYEDISAIVGDSPVIEYQPSRANLLGHEKVLERIMEHFTLLPVQFSTISPEKDNENVYKTLMENYEQYTALLDKMEGKKEMGLKIVAYENEFLEHILQKHQKIKRMRDELVNASDEKIQEQRLEVGRLVTEALKEEMENYKNYIVSKLSPLTEEFKLNDPFSEMMIMNAAFLIKTTNEPAFDNLVDEIHEELSHLMKFKYVGTIPPYNFVDIRVKS